MPKKYSLSISLVMMTWLMASPVRILAQRYGNEWINYNQQYYKIPVTTEGIYRISPEQLRQAGFPTGIDPRRIQLFHRGVEQAIFVSGEGDAVFNDSDYLEFYGKGNDGTQDSLLYRQPSLQPHKYYSNFSDTAAYFLTYQLDNTRGKRMASVFEPNLSGIPAETFHLERRLAVFTQDFSRGQEYPLESTIKSHLSQWDTGEGFTGTLLYKFANFDYTFTGLSGQVAMASVMPSLEVVIVGRNNGKHAVEVFVGASAASIRLLTTLNLDLFETARVVLPLQTTDIGPAGEMWVRIRPTGARVDVNDPDAISVSALQLTYPQLTDAASGSKKIGLAPKASGKSYLELLNPPASSLLYDITDPNNLQILETVPLTGRIGALISHTQRGRTLLLNTGFLNALSIQQVGFRKINPMLHNFLIITHQGMRRGASGVTDAARAYSDYRASAAGGGNDTLLVNMDLLYNQFSYGEKTPLAIRRFADFMLQNTSKQLFLFLIGLAREPDIARNNPAAYVNDLVPTGGVPGSDVVLTGGLNGTSRSSSAIPTGRLNARTPQDLLNYLNKVKEHEAAVPDLWRKNFLHLSGGVFAYELDLFRRYVDDFKRIVEGKFVGAKVTTISKKTDNPVEFINISDQVNKGLGWITFFGHAGFEGVDLQVGYVTDPQLGYNNKGRYPMMLINGCDAGGIFEFDNPTFGENWMTTPDKGCLAFAANSDEGYDTVLRIISEDVYRTLFADSIFVSKPIGVSLQEARQRFAARWSDTDGIYLSHAEQLVMQGDPSLQIIPTAKPDYGISREKIFVRSFDNLPVTSLTDSFRLAVVVSNFGKIDSRPLSISVLRRVENEQVRSADTLVFPAVFYQDTLYFTIRNRNLPAIGNNRFEIKVDARNQIDEISESNNLATFELFIQNIGILPLFPPQYGIVNQQPVRFQAQASGVLSGTREYVMEIDTSYLFNSPAKKSITTTARSVSSWEIPLLSQAPSHDSTVYYWRVRFNDQPESRENPWVERTFVYISNSPTGWSQSQFPQFSRAELERLSRNESLQRWEFLPTSYNIDLRVLGGAVPITSTSGTELSINGSGIVASISGPNISISTCVADGRQAYHLTFVAFDRQTGLPYPVFTNPIFPTANNPILCGREPRVANTFSTAAIQQGLLEEYVNGVKPGDAVLMFTNGTVDFSTMPASAKQKLAEIGATLENLNRLPAGSPYILFGKKGPRTSSVTEILPNLDSPLDPKLQVLTFSTVLTGFNTSGSITSTLIGPASAWTTLHQQVRPREFPSADKWQLDVLGRDRNGNETVLFQDVKTSSFPLSSVNAAQYPYLRLRLSVQDTLFFTPPLLKKWQVIYKEVPEGILNPDLVSTNAYQVAPKSEGERFSLPFVFQNITDQPFTDSLTIQYRVRISPSGSERTQRFKVRRLLGLDTVRFNIPLDNPIGSAGNVSLQVNVNPGILPEQNYANNVFELTYQVKGDKANPVLDVTFDGIRIMNGDIVSPQPLVAISLKDENRFLIRKDTTGMEIMLKKPCEGCNFERIPLNSPEIRYLPAGAENDFRMEYQPAQKLADGRYTLKVQGKDVSGNLSGTEPYQIQFEVINEASITHFYPYPNPFSTQTRFVFTLTGSQIPDQLKIQIMTVTGKVVKEILKDELGPLRIGNNISQYAWDGRDEFGDQLANGVYLYRVLVKNEGETLHHRKTAADKAFKKNFGKIYILR
jgi:hypothetical protein